MKILQKALFKRTALTSFVVALLVAACGGGSIENIPQLSPASSATIAQCTNLATSFSYASTAITASTLVTAGTLTNAGQPVAEHCLVTGKMNQRTSAIDSQTYAIGFEMRLPTSWSGRFLYQGNGGTDGVVSSAVGAMSGGGPLQNGLQLGFAVLSSDAGHSSAQNPLFGLDPQARLDYGYQAVGTLTPMAKALIQAAYGKRPDRSYIGGTSNGGRHTMVAATRYASDYDGFLAVSPGFNLPKAAVAQLYGAQQWNTVATTTGTAPNFDLESALTLTERTVLANAILSKCDALDGLADGMVNDVTACRSAFNLTSDVPTCAGARDGTCLSSAQKLAVGNVFAGAKNTAGTALYSRFPYDPGLATTGWADWKFRNSVRGGRDPVAVGYIFSSPPATTVQLANTLTYALNFNFDTDAPNIFSTSGVYTESGHSLMTPPNPANVDTMRARGAKMIVVHGLSDGVFSPDDTASWYDSMDARYSGIGDRAVRYFRVPGMGHSRGGPSTDQFDGLTALVNWVENGQAPSSMTATARGVGNAGGANTDVPATWAVNRTRPLCPYPKVARYSGSGSIDLAASFSCQ